jgi:hypothetical protein
VVAVPVNRCSSKPIQTLIFGVAICLAVIRSENGANGADIFADKVARILQERCLSCHNDADRKGDYSLQTAQSALADGHIVPGDSAASHLVELISTVDGKAEMPKDAEPLTAAEVEAIREWIDARAPWPPGFKLAQPKVQDFEWWSYSPVVRPTVPTLDDTWAASPIDAFVLRKLRSKGLSPSTPADRRTLLRRVTYDLIGLPPTPAETTAFLNDTSPDSYQRLVDRLLDSKQYGERWARHWLDVVKYADTCGYDKDKLRPNAWPYRDYVIRAFNEDKPYAKFVQEQLAGDVLFAGEADGILGLGFIAAGPWDFIGHVEVPESKIDGRVARNLDRDDMVSNTLNTFCSVTVQCARCHNHKFDPITQADYYGLQAIFAAVDRAERPFDVKPQVTRQRLALDAELNDLRARNSSLEKAIADAGGAELTALKARVGELKAKQKVTKEPQFGYHSGTSANAEEIKWVELELTESAAARNIVLHPCHDEFQNIGAGFGFPVRFKIEVANGDSGWDVAADQTQEDFPNPGLTPFAVTEINQTVTRVRVTATKLVVRSNDFNFALAEIEVIDANGKNVAIGAKVTAKDSIEAPIRWAKSNLTDGLWARGGDPASQDALATASVELDLFLAKIMTDARKQERESISSAMAKAETARSALPKGQMVYAASTHFAPQGNFKPTMGQPREVKVLHRGNVQQPGEVSKPRLLPLNADPLQALDGASDESARRAALAQWLTAKEHPLVWRSIVNRIWQYHFGQGIVATPNDFGRMGALPTHPELLDWLAVEFRDNGQSFKAMHRLILTSNVYRQGSTHDAAKAEVDGSNQYLWRMNRRRLEAEEIRDSILSVSGSLNEQMGGPGIYLFKLEKTDHSPHYEYHKFDPADESTHRRSIYRFIVRSQPDPWMTTLDCADSSQSTPRRNETLTSLQALSLLNNRFNLVMADRFASRLAGQSAGQAGDAKDLAGQVELAMQLVAQRQPTPDELTDLVSYAQKHGTANLCRFLFNLSEFVYLD